MSTSAESLCLCCCMAEYRKCLECGVTVCPICDGRICSGRDERQWNEDHYDPNADWDDNDYCGLD